MHEYRHDELNPDEQALKWIEQLPNSSEETRREFVLWIRRSPENLGAFLRQQALGKELEALPPHSPSDLEALVTRARTAAKIVRWPSLANETASAAGRSADRSHPVLRKWLIAAAITGLAIIAGVPSAYHYVSALRRSTYSTALGEQRQVLLPDGSTFDLNTQSAASVELSGRAYDIYLRSGEALFNVRHNPARPFRVHVGRMLIEDVGTQFDVRRSTDLTMVAVSVVEGSVRVLSDDLSPSRGEHTSTVVVAGKEYVPLRAPAQVTAGEQIRLVGNGALMEVTHINVPQATAWQQGRLIFNGTPLAEIAAQFNRYNRRKIVLYGDSLIHQRYSGVFSAKDPESFLEYLRVDRGIKIDDNGAQLIIRPR